MLCFSVTKVVGQKAMAVYSGELPITSSCINLDIPETLTVGQALVLSGSASSGTMNALAYDPDEDTEILSLSDCDLHSLNINVSYDPSPSRGMYPMTVIDWTDDPRCSLLVEHNLIVFVPQGQLSVPCAINQRQLSKVLVLGPALDHFVDRS